MTDLVKFVLFFGGLAAIVVYAIFRLYLFAAQHHVHPMP